MYGSVEQCFRRFKEAKLHHICLHDLSTCTAESCTAAGQLAATKALGSSGLGVANLQPRRKWVSGSRGQVMGIHNPAIIRLKPSEILEPKGSAT